MLLFRHCVGNHPTLHTLQDIIKQLCMDQPSSPPFRQWVMSFQRHNLHLSVQLKAGGGAAGNLAHLVTEALQGNSPGPTLIYAQTTNEVDTLAAHLQAKGIKAVKCAGWWWGWCWGQDAYCLPALELQARLELACFLACFRIVLLCHGCTAPHQ